MRSWGVVNSDTAYDAGLEYPDQTGTTANFTDIWSFRVRIYQDWMDSLENVCPAAWWLIQSTRYSHGDGTAAYIAFMVERMLEIRRVLKTTGSVYLHCDHEANAYLRQMMDAVFGAAQFRAEIIWHRAAENLSRKKWRRASETILYYSKSQAWTWNALFLPLDKERVEKDYRFEDARGKYTTTSCTNNAHRPNMIYDFNGNTRQWRYSRETMQALEQDGMLVYNDKGIPRRKRYLDEVQGNRLTTVWSDIQVIASNAKEATGYPTQKPQTLAKRIIEASSNPRDIVLDCFAGCAYVPIAAELSGRHWIACDMSPRAWTIVRRQFHKQSDLRIVTEGEYPESDTGVQPDLSGESIEIRVRGPHELPVKTTEDGPLPMKLAALPEVQYRQRAVENAETIWDAFVKEWGTGCWYCGQTKAKDRRELQLDHIEPNQRDGSNDDCWNRALACVACNSDKSDRLTVEESIDRALAEGRIPTIALRNEQVDRFRKRHAWAKERWEQISPKLPAR